MMLKGIQKYGYLFRQLVKRDFRQKYKKTTLGLLWSALNPLCEFAIMMLIFKNLFGRNSPHYTVYLLSGVLVYSMFSSATTGGMTSLVANSGILTKINVPKWIFVLSKNVSSLVDFGVTFLILTIYMFIDKIQPSWKFICLLFPVVCLILFNFGVSMILSSMYVFFKDTQYLYHIFCRLLNYCSAVFWRIEIIDEEYRWLFKFNPVFDYISYFRSIIIYSEIPDLVTHGICLGYALLFFLIGCIVYNCNKRKFIYYL
jgi:ABC-2 type transport system permease protein